MCTKVVDPNQDMTPMVKTVKQFGNQKENLPEMKAKLMKHKDEIRDDVMSALFYFKTEQYEKFGEFLGNIVKVAAQDEVVPSTSKPDNFFLY